MRTSKEMGAILLGILFIGLGGLLVVFPSAHIVPHHDAETGKYYLEQVSQRASRAYGVIAVIIGAGIVWLARWPIRGAKGTAIERYVWGLSQELRRRFGLKKYYTLEEVTKSAQAAHFNITFVVYAHAIFCSRSDFDHHYQRLQLACTYDGFRAVVSRRYFGGERDFDAASLVRATKKPNEEENDSYESGLAG